MSKAFTMVSRSTNSTWSFEPASAVNMVRSIVTISVVAAVSFASAVSATPLAAVGPSHGSGSGAGLAPIYTPPNVFSGDVSAAGVDSHVLEDRYIVVLKEEHGHRLPFHLSHLRNLLGSNALGRGRKRSLTSFVEGVSHHFDVGALKGYAGKFTEDTLEWIRRQDHVEFVERDTIVKALDIERGAPWGLARISHRDALRLGTLGKYEYAHNGGAGVDVYVVDTGVNIDHVELEGRAKWGKTMPLNDVDADGNGHGSHVAGTIASAKYGVAKDANIIAVKVLGSSGSGSMSDVVGGVAWAAAAASKKAESEEAKNGKHKGSVANMSLGGGKSAALDLAVNNAVKKGLHFAVAAGNDNRDACSYSPAGAELAITVGASSIADRRAYFSNWGKCVDIFAPGLNILSIWNTGNTSVNTISGTSMASPHIAGLTAYYLSLYPSTFAPSVEDYATAGVPFPGSEEERKAEGNGRSLFNFGKQLVFGKPFGTRKQESAFKPLHPNVLKAAMIRLSTKDALADIPADTPNFLAFNNYTVSAKDAPAIVKVSDSLPEEEEEQMFHAQPIYEKGETLVAEAMEELEEMVEKIVAEDLKWLTE